MISIWQLKNYTFFFLLIFSGTISFNLLHMNLEFSILQIKVHYFEKLAKCALTPISRDTARPKMESTWLDEASKKCVIQNSQCDINEVRWVLKSVGFVILDLSEIVSQQSGAEGGILNHTFIELHHLFRDLRSKWLFLLSALIAETLCWNLVARAGRLKAKY